MYLTTVLVQPRDFLKFYEDSRVLQNDPKISAVFRFVKKAVHEYIEAKGDPSHWKKRNFVSKFPVLFNITYIAFFLDRFIVWVST